MAAVTVTVAMRTVGLLLVSALMVVPVATAQQLTRGFRATLALALVLGVLPSLAGVVFSYYVDVAPGASIVVIALMGFALAWPVGSLVQRRRYRSLAQAAEADARLASDHVTAEQHGHQHDEQCGHPGVPHGNHVDYLHGGHLHAQHGQHYDEH
jgi:zinc transport system permease protein